MDTVDMVEETEHGVRTIVEEIIDKLIEVVVAKAEKELSLQLMGWKMNLQTHKYQEERKIHKNIFNL